MDAEDSAGNPDDKLSCCKEKVTDDARCPSCDQPLLVDPDLDHTVFAILDDHRVHRALGLPGAPVGPDRADPHVSAVTFSLHMMEEACKGAQLRYSTHGVVNDYGPPVVYHPGMLQKLNERQYGALLAAFMVDFTRTRAAGTHTSNWSMAVQAAQLNPLGHLFVSRTSRVEQIQEVQIRGAFAL